MREAQEQKLNALSSFGKTRLGFLSRHWHVSCVHRLRRLASRHRLFLSLCRCQDIFTKTVSRPASNTTHVHCCYPIASYMCLLVFHLKPFGAMHRPQPSLTYKSVELVCAAEAWPYRAPKRFWVARSRNNKPPG